MQSFTIPPRSAVGYLDPEIANEGVKVGADPHEVGWNPPPTKWPGPDMSEIKSIQKYFNRKDFRPFPAWIYHKDGEERIVANAEEAAHYGIAYRVATELERNKYGLQHLWDYGEEANPWRPKPWTPKKFDPKNPGQGKIVVQPGIDNAALLEAFTRAMQMKDSGTNDLAKAILAAIQQTSPALVEAVAEAPAKGAPKDVEESGSGMLGAFAREHSNKREKRG